MEIKIKVQGDVYTAEKTAVYSLSGFYADSNSGAYMLSDSDFCDSDHRQIFFYDNYVTYGRTLELYSDSALTEKIDINHYNSHAEGYIIYDGKYRFVNPQFAEVEEIE
jgi:hypothetical protein